MEGGYCIKKHVIFIVFLLCIVFFPGCSKVTILQFTKEEVESITVNTYDFENKETTINWVYKKNEMEELLNYLENLSGMKKESLNTKNIGNIIYEIELYAGNMIHHILFAGDYAITDEGKYYLIDKEGAEKICKSIVGDTTVKDNVNYIYNHRYLSLINDKWDTKYMNKSKWVETQLANLIMSGDKTVVTNSDEKMEYTIQNNSLYKISFGSQIELEALVDNVWYNIDDMINENVNLTWTLELITINPGESYKDDFYNLRYYQPLPKGKYRLIKEITQNDKKGYVAYEFEVNK